MIFMLVLQDWINERAGRELHVTAQRTLLTASQHHECWVLSYVPKIHEIMTTLQVGASMGRARLKGQRCRLLCGLASSESVFFFPLSAYLMNDEHPEAGKVADERLSSSIKNSASVDWTRCEDYA